MIQPMGMTQVSTLLSLEIPTHYNKEAFLSERIQSWINFLSFTLDIACQGEDLSVALTNTNPSLAKKVCALSDAGVGFWSQLHLQREQGLIRMEAK